MSRWQIIGIYAALGPPAGGIGYVISMLALGILIPPAHALGGAEIILLPIFGIWLLVWSVFFSYPVFLLQSAVHGVFASYSRSSDGLVRYWPVGLAGLLTGAVSMMLAHRFFTPALDDSIAIGLGSFISSLLVTKLYNYDRRRGKI
ncbi:hypothetical protein [Parvularcula sp. LCG005]|uniref:hypothetical protein n=1 Tax=Parvularcula sp. LCG005 TaxID=3078805 RepID=UPI002941C3C5|nr:hypothetical protein [Parvularcula sp. LCG005]WOI54194.1 hypothetical protein RUI03_04150 [Parvularcula sp. LCG005]